MTERVPVAAAALAGVPAGVQSQGVWAGRRQLFVRFAGEAETATMYTPDTLVREMDRQLRRSTFHSISVGGRDPLANVPFLLAAFSMMTPSVPVMLDTDGQRPSALGELAQHLSLVQVTVDFTGPDASLTHAMHTISIAAEAGRHHALVLSPKEDTTDTQMMRLVEQAHATSAGVDVVLHPFTPSDARQSLDRRWSTLMERLVLIHAACRLVLRVPPPAGMR